MAAKKISRMGRKVRTDPTPPMMPSVSRPLSHAGAEASNGSSAAANRPMSHSSAPCSGRPIRYVTRKTRPKIISRIGIPKAGLVRTWSMRSVVRTWPRLNRDTAARVISSIQSYRPPTRA